MLSVNQHAKLAFSEPQFLYIFLVMMLQLTFEINLNTFSNGVCDEYLHDVAADMSGDVDDDMANDVVLGRMFPSHLWAI